MPTIPAVLIVEDDTSTRHLLEVLVRRNDYEPVPVADGTAALEAIASLDFAAILLDLRLPGIDGWEILRRLHGAKPHLLRRVVVVTAASPVECLAFEPIHAVWCVVRKPFELRVLEEQLRECCAERRSEAARVAAVPHPPVKSA